MGVKSERLFFLDGLRAWAILMMLQGHFISSLLLKSPTIEANPIYWIWRYMRGVTAPVFFTVSGFVFTYILLKNHALGWKNPRIIKGFKRGIQLILIGYLLQLYIPGLFHGIINSSFIKVHVLQCIGLSILLILAFYIIALKTSKTLFPFLLITSSVILFSFNHYFKDLDYSYLPTIISNYFTKSNGSVFTIIPWFGYSSFGGYLSIIFLKYHKRTNFYTIAIVSLFLSGLFIMLISSGHPPLIENLLHFVGFEKTFSGSYLFIRLGDVMIIFSVFLLFRSLMMNSIVSKIGRNTLAIYFFHSVVLYGSFYGHGLTRYLGNSLSLSEALLGAFLFLILIVLLAFFYEKNEEKLMSIRVSIVSFIRANLTNLYISGSRRTNALLQKVVKYFRSSN